MQTQIMGGKDVKFHLLQDTDMIRLGFRLKGGKWTLKRVVLKSDMDRRYDIMLYINIYTDGREGEIIVKDMFSGNDYDYETKSNRNPFLSRPQTVKNNVQKELHVLEKEGVLTISEVSNTDDNAVYPIVAIMGASGSGKSTVEKLIFNKLKTHTVVSYTTRAPRAGELDGIDYHFVSEEEFKEKLQNGFFAEYDCYGYDSNGNAILYGSAKEDYQDGNILVVMTPNGVRQLKKSMPGMVYAVYLEVPLGDCLCRYINRVLFSSGGNGRFTTEDLERLYERFKDYERFREEGKELADDVFYNGLGTPLEEIETLVVDGMKRHRKGGF